AQARCAARRPESRQNLFQGAAETARRPVRSGHSRLRAGAVARGGAGVQRRRPRAGAADPVAAVAARVRAAERIHRAEKIQRSESGAVFHAGGPAPQTAERGAGAAQEKLPGNVEDLRSLRQRAGTDGHASRADRPVRGEQRGGPGICGVVGRNQTPAEKPLMRGFTLIEMLVVLAIIAILAMVAMPNTQNRFIRAQIVEAVPLADI